MKKIIFFLLLTISSTIVKGQPPKRFIKIANQYFISLPYNFKFDEWVSEIKNNNAIKTDSAFKDSAHITYLLAHVLTPLSAFAKTDSIALIIGKGEYIGKALSGNMKESSKKAACFLREILYFPKDSLSEKAWKELCNVTIKKFKKYFEADYHSIGENSIKYETVTFKNDTELAPIVEMKYGNSEKRPNCYFIWLQLNFRVSSS